MSHFGLPADVTRRQMLIRSAAVAALVGPGSALAAGCAAGSSKPKSNGGTAKTPDNPFGVNAADPLDVYIFKGGYGDDYAKAFEATYKGKFAASTVTHKGAQDVTGDLQPRFNAGNPPDVIDDSGAKQLKLDVLNKGGQLTNLDQLLAAPSFDDPSKKVSDVLLPGTREIGLLGSSMFSLNYFFTVWGLWYSNANTPPDVVDDSGAKQLKLDVLNKGGQLTNLDQLLDAPSFDDPSKKVRDVLLPGTREIGLLGSSMYSLNYFFTVWGLWYSNATFQKNGWQVPKTWDDFMTLCDTIKKSGVAPFCHQGKYPYYMLVPLMDMVAKNGGPDVMAKIDNLEPNAWKDDAVKNSVEALYMLVDKGYMLPGTEGLTHLQSQTQWNEGKAAIIPCGSWLENEQLASTPAGFDMAVMAMPSLTGDKMPGTSIRAGAGEPFIVPSKAKNQAGGLEFLRIMCSKAAGAALAQTAHSLSVVKDSITPDIAAKLLPGTKSSNDLYQAANGSIITWYYINWYSQMETDMENAMGDLMANKIKPAEFISRCQAAADKTAADSSIQKNKRPTT